MKKIMPVLLLFFLSSSLVAQDNAISKYFGEHLDDPSFEQFIVSEESFDQFADVETDDFEEQQVLDALAQLEGILVLTKDQATNSETLYRNATTTIAGDGQYEELVTVEHDSENLQILIREELSTVREFLLIAGGQQNFVIASLYGDIDLAKIMQLGKSLRHNGKDWFDLIESDQTKELVFKADKIGQSPTLTLDTNLAEFEEIRVYPNVVIDKVTIQDKAAADGTYQLEFFSLMGERVQSSQKIALPHTLEFNDLPSGAYFLRLTNQAGGYKNFRIVKP